MVSRRHASTILFALITFAAMLVYGETPQSQTGRQSHTQRQGISGELRLGITPAMPESLGDGHLGYAREGDLQLILDRDGKRLIDLDANLRGNPEASRNLLLPDKSHIAAGFVVPLPGELRFKQVFNRHLVDSSFGENYMGLGSYLAGVSGGVSWNFGYERDSKRTALYSGMGERRLRADVLVAGGVSYTDARTGNKEKGTLRSGAGLVWTLPNTHNHQLMGGLVNTFDENARPTYIGGIARCANNRASGPDPNYLALYRNRPESQYALGLVTLGGKSLQCRVNESIFSAFVEGGLGPVRIVNNRNFDTLGVGGSYRTQEYGKLALAISLGRTRITQAVHRTFADVELYYTFDVKVAVFANPFVGVGYAGGDDVFFDAFAARPGLASRYSDMVRVSAGGKFHLADRTIRFAVTPSVDLRTHKLGGTVELSTYF